MKRKNKFNKVLIAYILIILTIILQSITSLAISVPAGLTEGSLGKSLKVSYLNADANIELCNDNYVYCVQEHSPLSNDIYNYRVQGYVDIDGSIANFKVLDENGNEKDFKTNNEYNAELAYILGYNYDSYEYSYSGENYTTRQKMVWGFWNTWCEENALKESQYATILRSYKHNGNNGNYYFGGSGEIRASAKNYAESIQANVAQNATLENNSKNVTSQGTNDGGEYVGPFNIKYTGNISSITVKDEDEKTINASNIKYYDKDGKELKSYEDIKNKEDFYIKNSSKSQKVKNVSIKVTAEAKEKLNVKIWFLQNAGGKSTQNLIVAVPETSTNNPASIDIPVERQKEGNVKLIKEDANTQNKLAGAEFKISTKSGAWLKVDSLGVYDYNATFDEATTFKTDAEGILTVNNLKSGQKITIYETKAPEGYKLEWQDGYDGTKVKCNSTPYEITTNDGKPITITIQNKKTGNLEIVKSDTNTGTKLNGAEFKISCDSSGDKSKNVWLKRNDDGNTYSYTSSFNDATTFTTNKDGVVEIKDLEPDHEYYIYEVKAPKGYNIKVQEKYDSQNNWVSCGKGSITAGKTVTVSLKNSQLISLEGYVWVEAPGSKANDYDDILDVSESIITDKVTITLRNKSDGSIVQENPTIVTEEVTLNIKDKDGKEIKRTVACYKFEKIVYSKLKDYYVHFDYKEGYEKYITVASDFMTAGGSKALSDNVPEYDKDLVGMATTYKGSQDEAKYGLSGLAEKFYNESTYTLENINLGIKELPATDYTISENPAYVDMSIKGYNYRYIYGGTGEKIQTVPTIKWQGKTDKEAYTRAVYPSDIEYTNPEDHTQELDIHITYRIDITNNTMTDIPYLYQEKYLNVKSLTNKFDTDIYTLEDGNWEMTTNESGDLVAKIKDSYLQERYYEDYGKSNGISNEDGKNNKCAYITFRLKPDAIKCILRPEGLIEALPVTATVTAYHKYTRIDYSWENSLLKEQTHRTNEDIRSDAAYYFGWEPGENRTISGTVFEDTDSNAKDSEALGNGLYDEKENKVKDVLVELGNYNKDGKFVATNLCPADENKKIILDESGNYLTAKQTTSKDGKYSFEGIVPGEYYIRFTYGDGTQKICDLNGNEIKDVYSNEYKSTIVTSEIKTAFETKYEDTQARWYLGIKNNYNTAVDDLTIRSKASITATSASLKVKDKTPINAYTPIISIPIEYKINTVGLSTDEYPNELGYMNFGIITIPETKIDIEKKITGVKITLQNGQILAEGNPATQNVAYVADLDKKTEGGSTYVKVEMNSEYIYGSTLEIKYDITVANNSDLDYIEESNNEHYGYYYKYGIKDYATEKTVTIDTVYDYMDPKLSYKSKDGTPEVNAKNVAEIKKKDAETLTDEEKGILSLVQSVEKATGLDYSEILEITNWGALNSSKGANSSNSSSKVTINAERILTTNDDDLEFKNIAGVIKITVPPVTPPNVPGDPSDGTPEDPQDDTPELPETQEITLTVTPATGGDRSILYFAVGAIALVVLATGVIVIKKKVLK